MKNIRIVQVGLGPLGIKIGQFIAERDGLETVAAIDKNPGLIGKSLASLSNELPDITIEENFASCIDQKPDVAVLTTVSDMQRITPQIIEIVSMGIPVVSTCEELSYPWITTPSLASQIDSIAQKNNVAVVGTGVNPGFLMDSLPTFLTSVCQQVESIEVNRFQDAAYRRIPFQKKIGAGATMEKFEKRKADGSLRHVGLTESLQYIASNLGWTLDKTEDIISPVMAENDIDTNGVKIKKGLARGVMQVGNGYVDGEVKIKLVFKAAVGEPSSYDEIIIKGTPDIHSKIEGGVNGDVATCAITVNCTRSILEAKPGLRTMSDLPNISYFS